MPLAFFFCVKACRRPSSISHLFYAMLSSRLAKWVSRRAREGDRCFGTISPPSVLGCWLGKNVIRTMPIRHLAIARSTAYVACEEKSAWLVCVSDLVICIKNSDLVVSSPVFRLSGIAEAGQNSDDIVAQAFTVARRSRSVNK
jgi:hypothetical protein